MTDPATSYVQRDELRAVDHDRIATIYRGMWLLMPMTLVAIFSAGALWLRVAAHETRLTILTAEMRVVERVATRTDERLAGQIEILRRIEAALEELRRKQPQP